MSKPLDGMRGQNLYLILSIAFATFSCQRFAWQNSVSASATGVSGAAPGSGTPPVSIPTYINAGLEAWAQGVSTGANISQFTAVATDSSGNAYAAGFQYGSGSYSYGSQSAAGPCTACNNAVLVKYDATGAAVWASATSGGASTTQFNAIAADNAGNTYAAGFQSGSGAYTYGGQTATAAYAGGNNALLVKYDAAGNALWAQTTSAATNTSEFKAVAVDGSGNIYAAGYQSGTAPITYGSQSATATYTFANVILVKYDYSGTALWARTISAGSNLSYFYGVAADSSGNVYAVGSQQSTSAFTYGSISATGSFPGTNVVIVKYDTNGTALWANSMSGCSTPSQFNGAAVDGFGNAYAVGYQSGNSACTYSGQSVSGPFAGGFNAIVVKYDPAGTGVWARSATAASNASEFKSVTVDSSGNIYAAGYQTGNAALLFGTASATGAYASGNNVALVKIDTSGTALWMRTVSSGGNISQFNGVATDPTGYAFSAGFQTNNITYTYGSQGITGAYASGANAVLVKYQ